MKLLWLKSTSHRRDSVCSRVNSLLCFISWPQYCPWHKVGCTGKEQTATSRVLVRYKSVPEVQVKLTATIALFHISQHSYLNRFPSPSNSVLTHIILSARQPPNETRAAETIQLENSPRREGTSYWTHLNAGHQQQKHLLNHHFAPENTWVCLSFTFFFFLSRRSVTSSFITILVQCIVSSMFWSQVIYSPSPSLPLWGRQRDSNTTIVCKVDWKYDST